MVNNNENAYISCNIIEHGFDAQFNTINLCCRVSKETATYKHVLIPNYRGEKIDWNNFFNIKNQLRSIQKSGETIPCCEGCTYLENNIWDNENYINTININNWIKCNASCIYCDRAEYKHIKEYNLYPMIKDLVKKKLLKMPVDITIAGGEPTITRDFDKILKILIKNNYSPIRVLTNAIKYNKHIENGLSRGLVNILVSTDSGTDETYYKIKKVKRHKDVWKNLAKYVKNQKINSLVKTKYIIIPGINSNEEELKEYINRNSEANIKHACIDVEIGFFIRNNNNSEIMKQLYDLYLYAKNYGKEKGINVTSFDRMGILENKFNQ